MEDKSKAKAIELSFKQSAGGLTPEEEELLKKLREENALKRRASTIGSGESA
jgi:hypothetical protein